MTPKKDWFAIWFDSPYYHQLYRHRSDEEAAAFIDRLIDFLKPPPGSKMFDLACGKGRHSIHLASKGFDVTGADLSANSIEIAKQSESENLAFFVHDMRRLFRSNYFDYIFNFFTSFGYFDKMSDNDKVIHAVAKGMKPGGTFVIDFMNAAKSAENLVASEAKVINNIEFKIKRKLEDRKIIKEINFSEGGESYHFEEKVSDLRLEDFEGFLKNNGLQITQIFGDYHLQSFDVTISDRLILVAQKLG